MTSFPAKDIAHAAEALAAAVEDPRAEPPSPKGRKFLNGMIRTLATAVVAAAAASWSVRGYFDSAASREQSLEQRLDELTRAVDSNQGSAERRVDELTRAVDRLDARVDSVLLGRP